MVDISIINNKKKQLESVLHDIIVQITDQDSTIEDIVFYNIFPGGKRLRALLSLLMYEALGGKKGNIYICACVPELLHIATIMLDDLPCMDDSNYRRNKLSSHKKFGEANTILAAFGLATKSFSILSDKSNLGEIDSQKSLKMIEEITHKIGFTGLIGGQIADLNLGKNVHGCKNDEERLDYIAYNKTATLFETCAIIASYLAEATNENRKRLLEYTRNFGLALQIFDDLQDIDDDKGLSFSKVYGIEKTKKLLLEKIKASHDCIIPTNKSAQLLRMLPQYLLEINT
ncbi:polyprenyl synthetase family protein [Candidatus Dependentiae bacterium]